MLNGLLLLDKPRDISSNKYLTKLKKIYSFKKSGIVGVLDPLADGMLPIVIGEATKLAQYIEAYEKEYYVECELGKTSSTGDGEGNITEMHSPNIDNLNQENIAVLLKSFLGPQNQIPPMHSAIKVNGKKLYTLARKGVTIERKPRSVTVHDIKLIDCTNTNLILQITCSKGTYIRTLIEDIGKKLLVGAYVTKLRRTRIGKFSEEMMLNPANLPSEIDCESNYFIGMNNIVSGLSHIVLNQNEEKKMRTGQYIKNSENTDNSEILLFNSDNDLIGVGIVKDDNICPKRLLNFS